MLELVQDEDEEKEVSGIEVFSIESHSPSAPGLTTFKDRRKKNTKTKRTPFKLEKMEYDMGPMEITVELEDFQKRPNILAVQLTDISSTKRPLDVED
ncbi:hypothetical protein QZH41_006118 [Actinostola sp. cb2023]|nr:hypothetical protein QZH41_006118 [Actinostola sp. cb2023]